MYIASIGSNSAPFDIVTRITSFVGQRFRALSLPTCALIGFEPSQIGTIVGTLLDGMIPHLPIAKGIGLIRATSIIGEREGYPDYNCLQNRIELKLLYVDNLRLEMKRPNTPREASARLNQHVTLNNVIPEKDLLLVLAYQLRTNALEETIDTVSPEIIDLGLFPMIDVIKARDQRLLDAGGIWSGDYQTPLVLSRQGKIKKLLGQTLDAWSYGRKESEGRDYNEDTNFGKLNRIPYKPLEHFIEEMYQRID